MSNILKDALRIQDMFLSQKPKQEVFDLLLHFFLQHTQSEYGFIGEILHKKDNTPYLKTHAITNIAWNKETRDFYDNNAPNGLEFYNLKTLFGKVITDHEILISENPYTDKRRGGLPNGHPTMNNFLGVPLMHEGNIIGMFGIANTPVKYDDEMIKMIDPLINACVNVILGQKILNTNKNYQDLILEKNAVLENHLQRMNQFTHVVSHDVRKHTSNMESLINLLDDQESTLEMGFLKKSCEELRMTIDFLSKVVDIENPDDILNDSEINLKRLIETSFMILDNHENQIELELDIDQDLKLVIPSGHFKSIVNNILSNAIKYRDPKKNSFVKVKAEKKSKNLILSFSDNGLGFNYDDDPDTLWAWKKSYHNHEDSKGLGMFITDNHIKQLELDIRVYSSIGLGTSFELFIPLNRLK